MYKSKAVAQSRANRLADTAKRDCGALWIAGVKQQGSVFIPFIEFSNVYLEQFAKGRYSCCIKFEKGGTICKTGTDVSTLIKYTINRYKSDLYSNIENFNYLYQNIYVE